MKKNIDNKKLDEMLENIYKSEPSHTFQYNSNYVSEKHTGTAGNSEYVVSGVEHIRKGISPAKFVSIAAACIIAVTSGAVYLENHVSTGGYSSPAAQSDISDITDEADISEEKSLFDKYLEEFEYEISNFDYECIKVTPNAEPNSYEKNQNYIYSDICHDVNIVPAYENCSFIDTDGSSQSFAVPDENFYFYIKKIDVPISENEATKFYTRQSYLVWKDADGNITKIRPSAEKVTAEEIENKLDCNYDIDIPEKVDSLLNDLSDESKEVYIDDILVRPAVAEENRNGEPKVSIAYDYYVYVNFNGQLVPVNVETAWYNSTSIMKFDDNYKATENIPFFEGKINDNDSTVTIKKTFFWDCSGDEPVDISSYIAELNNNYWLETAERSEPAETTETTAENQTIDKEYILDHMLNSIDFFDTAEGEFTTYNTGYNTETALNVSFAVNYSDDISERFAFEKYTNADGSYNGEYFRMNKFTYSDTNGDVYYNYSEIEINDYIPAAERMDKTKPGVDAWIYRDDMTERIVNYGKECFMYQELAFSKLYDTSLWEITGETNMFGYDGIVIEGNSSSDSRFKLIVEKNTGIILDYEEYTGDELTSYIHVNKLSIDNGLSVNQTELKDLYSQKVQFELNSSHANNLSIEDLYNQKKASNSNDKPFCFSDLADMDEESINALIEKYGDALQRTETGFTLCSYCLEVNGFDISKIEIYPDAYFNDCPDFNSTNHDIEINESNYTLKVHFPNQSENVSAEVKEMNEKFHNCPWAELILN